MSSRHVNLEKLDIVSMAVCGHAQACWNFRLSVQVTFLMPLWYSTRKCKKVLDFLSRVLFPFPLGSLSAAGQTTGNWDVCINPMEVAPWCLISKQALGLDCWTTFLPGVLGEPVVWFSNTHFKPSCNEKDGERDGGMQGRKKCSVSAAYRAALSYLKNPQSPQRIC